MMLNTDTVPAMPSASVIATDAEKILCFHRLRTVCRRWGGNMFRRLLILRMIGT